MKLVAHIKGVGALAMLDSAGQEQHPHSQSKQAVMLEIAEEDGAFLLFSFDATGQCVGDTWHQTEDEAKRQAHALYGVPVDAWNREGRDGPG
jgi:hypothetical protein